MRAQSTFLLLLATLVTCSAMADVSVQVGPTYIPRGDAQSERDITVSNGRFAVAFGVDSEPPWGVARGGIIDIAIWRDGEIGFDIASLADFMPNRWSAWPTTYQDVTIAKESRDEVVIRTTRDFGDVELETVFRIRSDDSKIHIVTKMTNRGDTALPGMYTGYSVWPDGGTLIGTPGIDSTLHNIADDSLRAWSAAYGASWLVATHAPFATYAAYGGRDRYLLHDLDKGETAVFEAWVQVENNASLAPVVGTEIEIHGLGAGTVHGVVSNSSGEAVESPVLVARRDGQDYAWTFGNGGEYSFNLPAGRYEIYATAESHSQSEPQSIEVTSDSNERLDFDGVELPGSLAVRVTDARTGRPLDARIEILSGPTPPIGYFGKTAMFTELDSVGSLEADISPGDYEFLVSAGGGFISQPSAITRTVAAGETTSIDAKIELNATPQDRGWYSADLHHHSDVLDGFTEPEFVMRSELAAGLDLTFLSDHDSVRNNAEMQALSNARDILFIAGTEMSPSWAHFNAYPLDPGKQIDIDPSRSTVQEIFAAARRMGADVIEVNHPFQGYGYFRTYEANEVPGKYDPGFELVEIEASFYGESDDRILKTLDYVWRLWNQGVRVYFASGSDSHSVWIQPSGKARTYVHVDGELTINKFIASLKAGKAFATQGPLVFPEIMFGTDISHVAGDILELNYSVQAVSGLRSVQLIASGFEAAEQLFDGAETETPVSFSVAPDSDRWYSLVIEDANGQFAYSNPIWITIAE